VNKIQALTVAVVVAAAVIAAAIFGDASSAASQKAPKGALISTHKTGLGKVIADARGHTLYLFEKDKSRMSSCNGACLAYWPAVLTSAKPRAGAGVRASLLGVTKRADGRRQVTYAGHPLYRFVGDTRSGQTTGEGLGRRGRERPGDRAECSCVRRLRRRLRGRLVSERTRGGDAPRPLLRRLQARFRDRAGRLPDAPGRSRLRDFDHSS
jgi:predicted lipoprotein with Yx(FWY)xxD motif